MTNEQRVKEVWPDAHSYKWTGRWLIYKNSGVCDKDIVSDSCETEAEAWADAASRLPKAEAAVNCNRNDCEGCGEPVYLTKHYGYSHVDTTLNVGCDARPKASHESVPKVAPPVEEGEVTAQTFEEWWKVYRPQFDTYSAVGWEGVALASWNAAKASSPAVVGGEGETHSICALCHKGIFRNSPNSSWRHDGLGSEFCEGLRAQPHIKDVRGKE